MDKAWDEINRGAELKTPKLFYYIIKYITPAYLFVILIYWTYQEAIPTLLMSSKSEADIPYLWGARLLMVLILSILLWMIYKGWKINKFNYHID
jgi:hypothetical protein